MTRPDPNDLIDRTMKLSELKPCTYCGGPLTGENRSAPIFHVVEIRHAMIDANAVNEVLGMTRYFQGALGLAEVMAPREPIKVSKIISTTMICNDCLHKLPLENDE